MLIDTERLRWIRPHKGYFVWTTDPDYASDDYGATWPRRHVESFGVELGPEEYLVEKKYLKRPGESQDEVDARLMEDKGPPDMYTPGNIQNLYKIFAFTEPNRDQIMAFAEKYGDLGLSRHYHDQFAFEPISSWMFNVIYMRQAYCLWSAIKREDEQELIAMSKQILSISREPPGTVQWAWHEIAFALSLGLTEYNFDHDFEAMYSSVGSDPTGLQYRFVPRTLISLIWLQFAAVVTGGNRWNVCQYCGEPFEIKRKGQKACSESHRQMAYRKRKQSKK